MTTAFEHVLKVMKQQLMKVRVDNIKAQLQAVGLLTDDDLDRLANPSVAVFFLSMYICLDESNSLCLGTKQ